MAETERFTLPPHGAVKHGNPGSIVVATGSIALDGTNPTVVDCQATHGIQNVLHAIPSLKSAADPGDGTTQVSASWSGSTLNLWGWTHTGATDPTLTDSTGTETIGYLVIGTV